MRKFVLCSMVCVMLAGVLLAGCGSSDSGSTAPVGSTPDTASTPQSEPADPAGTDAPAAPAEYQVVYRDAVFGPGDDAAAVLAALGEDCTVEESPSCLDPNASDMVYTYPDVIINVSTIGAQDNVISMVTLDAGMAGDAVATARGVKLGDSLDEVLLVYDGVLESDGSGSRYVAQLGQVELAVNARDGQVVFISYLYLEN